MSHAQVCPVCGGSGKKPVYGETTSTYTLSFEICNGCGGNGWVTVQDDEYITPLDFAERIKEMVDELAEMVKKC